jgi:pentafunctional AROM polypeptide
MRRVSDLPLIYSLRTLKQGGSFTFEHSTPADYARLAETAYKCGIEYLELGLDIDRDILRSILKKKPPYVSCILSFYDTEGHLSWMSSQVLAKYHEAIALGADIVKLVLVAQAVEDNLALHHFLQARAAEKRRTRLIAYNVGHLGKMSALFNQTFTPVYHPILSVPIAPGTTTFGETQQALFACGLVSTSYLLCSQSNERAYAAFMRGIQLLNLPIAVKEHDGDINEAGKLGAVGEFEMKGSEHIKYASNASRWIALSDTVARGLLSDDVQQGSSSSYYHDNMQMQAIAACIAANLSPINAVTHKSVAVLLGAHGAGGRAAAYALLHLGVQQIICFECEEGITAEEAFSSTDAEGLSVQIPPTIVVSFSLPEMLAVCKGLLESPTGGVALNLSQGNSVELGSMTSTTRCKESWIHVDTIDVERIRITRQFEMITGHRLPKAALAM